MGTIYRIFPLKFTQHAIIKFLQTKKKTKGYDPVYPSVFSVCCFPVPDRHEPALLPDLCPGWLRGDEGSFSSPTASFAAP
jgi:hypothetical protein